MSMTNLRQLTWTARVLAILFVLFISMFALDAFDAGYGFLGTLVALTMHLLPSLVLAVGVALGWRWPWAAALAFFGFAAWYVLNFSSRFVPPIVWVLAGIPAVVAVLYLLVWWLPRQERHA